MCSNLGRAKNSVPWSAEATYDGIKVALACHKDPELTPTEVVRDLIGAGRTDERIMYSKQVREVSGVLLKGIASGMIRVESADNVVRNHTPENGAEELRTFAQQLRRCHSLTKRLDCITKAASLISNETTSL